MPPVELDAPAPGGQERAVAQREPAARRRGPQVRHQRPQEHDGQGGAGRPPAHPAVASAPSPSAAGQRPGRRRHQHPQQRHGRAQVEHDRGRRQLQPDGHRAEEHLDHEQPHRPRHEPAERAPGVPPPRPPGVGGHGHHQQAHHGGRQAVAPLDEGREVHQRDQLAVAQRPVGPAAHPAPRDPDDPAQRHQQPGRHRGGEGHVPPPPDGGGRRARPVGGVGAHPSASSGSRSSMSDSAVCGPSRRSRITPSRSMRRVVG